jgi:hypothetical protein
MAGYALQTLDFKSCGGHIKKRRQVLHLSQLVQALSTM